MYVHYSYVLNWVLKQHLSTLIRREKNCLGGLQTTKAQTSLRIRTDLEITQRHQTRPSAAVRSVGHDHF